MWTGVLAHQDGAAPSALTLEAPPPAGILMPTALIPPPSAHLLPSFRPLDQKMHSPVFCSGEKVRRFLRFSNVLVTSGKLRSP